MGQSTVAFLFLAFAVGVCWADTGTNTYYGRLIGSLESQHHGIRGDVYAVDARTIFIKSFSYDGKGEDALFYAGSSSRVGTDGFVVPNEDGSTEGLSRSYDNQDLTLTLPEGKTIKEIRWLTVWSRSFSEAFGEVRIPSGFDYPRPQRLAALSGIHKVASDRIYVVDAQTFLLPNFTYDGGAPDAFFWVGSTSKPSQEGAQVPDENGKTEPLRRYDTKTLVLTLPGDLTVFDVEWLSVWCRAYGIDFGHIRIPKNLNVPPSLKMLGVAPQAKLNCEVLWDDLALEVRWAVAGETIVLQLVGKIDDRQYVAFGPSGDPKRTRMIGADVAVGWLDRESGKGFVHDHYITSKGPCTGGKGVCQDTVSARGFNNIRLLNAALVNDYVMLTYQRPLKAQDDQDRSIITNGTQAVIWAVGALGQDNEPTYHKLRNKGDLLIDFGRSPFWNCPAPEDPTPSSTLAPHSQRRPIPTPTTEDNSWASFDGNAVGSNSQTLSNAQPLPISNKPPWYIPAIECNEPENHVYYAHLGPNGGAQGYNAITGQVGWGISWFINGLLIPEVTVVRGQTYTFVVEGGQDPDRPSRYHPFYITDDSEGGYEFKTPAERSKITIYAGVTYDRDGNPAPSALGRLCEWVEDPTQPAEKFSSFGAYQRTLKLHCEEGDPAILQFTPDDNTPDTVYYQSYIHRYLGWKIRVVDSCEIDNGNRKADLAGQPNPPSGGNVSRRPVNEEPREDADYYDDDVPRIQPGKKQNVAPTNNLDFVPEHRAPPDHQGGFFPEAPFGNVFPSDFGEFFKESPFAGREEDRLPPPPQRPTAPPAINKPVKKVPVSKPIELTPVIVKAEVQQPQPNIPGPLKQLNHLINHASNLNQQPGQQQNQQREPPRNQVALERPLQPVRPQERPKEKPVVIEDQREQQHHNLNPTKTTIPTKISPPPLQKPINLAGPTTAPSAQRPYYHHQIDPFGGVFNPDTVILESGFKPIRKNEGPVPPLGFDVEARETVAKEVISDETRVTSEPPSLVTLDPVFIASEPDHRRAQDPVPIPLPKAVVPVVPGPSAPVQKFPPPQFVNPLPNNPQFRPPPTSQRQPIRPPFNGQDPNNSRPPPPSRKKSSFASFFNFGSQRRKEQQNPPVALPVAPGPPPPIRPPFDRQVPQAPQGPQLLRHPSAGQPGEQLSSLQQRLQQDEQLKNQNINPALNRPRPPQQPLDRNVNSVINRPQSPQQTRPQQGLTGLLQRFLGGGERRKESSAPEIIFPPGLLNRTPPRPPPSAKADSPHVTFQGQLPPIIATKVQSASRPVFDGLRRSDRPLMNPNVLDQFSASIIGGKPVMGLPGIPPKAVISDAERAQLERFLFGPAEHYTPRSFSAGSFMSNLEELLSGEQSTDLLSEDYTEQPDLSTVLTVVKDEEIVAVPENPENVLAEGSDKEEESRQKRQTDDGLHHEVLKHLDKQFKDIVSSQVPVEQRGVLDENGHSVKDLHDQVLKNFKDLVSSQLPVEHRGILDDNEHDHPHSGSSQLSPLFSMAAALLLFAGLTRFQHHHL